MANAESSIDLMQMLDHPYSSPEESSENDEEYEEFNYEPF